MSSLRSGIYALYCVANEKRYVGSAVDLSSRKATHIRQLKNAADRSDVVKAQISMTMKKIWAERRQMSEAV